MRVFFGIILIMAFSVNADLILDIFDQAKILTNPLDFFFMQFLDKACYLAKKFGKLQYNQMVANGNEPNLRSLEVIFSNQKHKNVALRLENLNDVLKYIDNPKDTDFYVIFHGFLVNPNMRAIKDITDFIASKPNKAVISLDASSLIGWFYMRASTYVRFIGEAVGKSLAFLNKNGQRSKNMYLIGHSLGAHIAGFAGKSYKKQTGKQILKITGLDPAGPCFAELDKTLRIQNSDAQFVEVVHTNAGFYGINENLGRIDYWVNGGRSQTGCALESCSHNRALDFFYESMLQPKAFVAIRCKDWATFKKNGCGFSTLSYMGQKSHSSGNFYLRTNKRSPFGLFGEGITYKEDSLYSKIKRNLLAPFKLFF